MKKMTPKHIITKLLKTSDKENILKAAKDNVKYGKTKIRMTLDFSLKTMQ